MSSYYGIVWPEFWTGDTGRAIQAQGGQGAQLAALYLMTCRHATMIGLFSMPIRDIKHETAFTQKGLERAFAVLAVAGFADYDVRTEHVWVKEMAKFRLNLPKRSPLDADDNRVVGVQRLYDKLAANPFLEPFFDRYAKELRLKGRRTCGIPATPLQALALTRGLEGPPKPDNRSTGTGIRDQGPEDQDQNLPPRVAQRTSPTCGKPNDDEARPEAGGMAAALCDRQGADRSRALDRELGVVGTHQDAAAPIGFHLPRGAERDQPGDGSGRAGDVKAVGAASGAAATPRAESRTSEPSAIDAGRGAGGVSAIRTPHDAQSDAERGPAVCDRGADPRVARESTDRGVGQDPVGLGESPGQAELRATIARLRGGR